MKDRIRDGFVLVLLGVLVVSLDELTVREGRIAGGLAGVLALSALAPRRPRLSAVRRVVFLIAVLFLAVQPFSVDPARAVPIPARALWVLAMVLALWTHMNVQSVSGKLAWRFSTLDVGVLAACALTVLASLGILWYRSDASDVVPQVLLQGTAIACGVLYLYLSRWRPDPPAARLTAWLLVGLLLAGLWGSAVRGREFDEVWQESRSSWRTRAPEPGEVDSLVGLARLSYPERMGEIHARAARAAVHHGRPIAARDWLTLALLESPRSALPWIARAELAAANGEDPERLESVAAAATRLTGEGAPPPLDFLTEDTALWLAVELLDTGRPGGALGWVADSRVESEPEARLLRAEALLQLGRVAETEGFLGALLAEHPDSVEILLGATRARLAGGDREGAWLSLRRGASLGAPDTLLIPLLAQLAPDGDPAGDAARLAMGEGVIVVAREDWPDRHPLGNFLNGSNEDRRNPLLLHPGSPYELLIEARGEAARRQAPRLRVELDGRLIGQVSVTETWAEYGFSFTSGRSGATIRIRFPNDYFDPRGEDRNLVLGEVRLREKLCYPGPAVTPTSPSGVLDRIAGGRTGLDRALMIVVTGMVALSFKTAPWQSLHFLGWVLMAAAMVQARSWMVPGPRRWALAWGVFATWVLVSSLLGPAPMDGLYDGKKLLNLLAIFLIGAVLRSAEDGRRVLGSVCVISSLLSVIGLYQFATTTEHIAFRSHGLSHHMTHSGMLLVTLCLVLPQLTFRRRLTDLLFWGYAVLGSLALLATLTRSAWIGLAVALSTVLLFKNPRWLLALPVALVLLFATVPEVRERTLSIVDTRSDYSNVQRLSMYRTGLRMIADNPALGLGGRKQVVQQYGAYEGEPQPPPPTPDGLPNIPYQTPDHLHNNLLQLSAAFGLPALLAWLSALGIWLREILRLLPRRRRIQDESGRHYRNLLLSSLSGGAGFLTMGMLEYNFGDSEVAPLFAFALAIPFFLSRTTPPAMLPDESAS